MEDSRWWSKLLAVSAVISILLLLSGPFGYKFGVTDLGPSLIGVLVAVVAAGIVLVGSIVMLVVASKNGLVKDKNLVLIAAILSLVPLMTVTPQIIKGRSVPPIHDISTDTVNPPEFDKITKIRSKLVNDLVYDHNGSKEALVELQTAAYPDVGPLTTNLSLSDAVTRAEVVLRDMGLEIVNVDEEQGLVEATATTFWFGFKDDMVVRLTRVGDAVQVDARSVSRVGQSDIGVNAARIKQFMANFK